MMENKNITIGDWLAMSDRKNLLNGEFNHPSIVTPYDPKIDLSMRYHDLRNYSRYDVHALEEEASAYDHKRSLHDKMLLSMERLTFTGDFGEPCYRPEYKPFKLKLSSINPSTVSDDNWQAPVIEDGCCRPTISVSSGSMLLKYLDDVIDFGGGSAYPRTLTSVCRRNSMDVMAIEPMVRNIDPFNCLLDSKQRSKLNVIRKGNI